MKLRPFFWNKVAWKPDRIWATVPPGVLSEDQLSALEALFPQTSPSPQAKTAKAKSEAVTALDTQCSYTPSTILSLFPDGVTSALQVHVPRICILRCL